MDRPAAQSTKDTLVMKGMQAAAHLIETRIESIRRGSQPLDGLSELELAAEAIRKLAGRFSEAQALAQSGEGERLPTPWWRRLVTAISSR